MFGALQVLLKPSMCAGGRHSIDLDCIPHKSLHTYFSSIWIQ